MATKVYDAGRPTAARKNADGSFSVDSHRGAECAYIVRLEGDRPTCSCPHYVNRLASEPGTGDQAPSCKHIASCRAQQEFLKAAERAQKLPDDRLAYWLKEHGNDPLVGGALRVERLRREQYAQEQDELRSMFS